MLKSGITAAAALALAGLVAAPAAAQEYDAQAVKLSVTTADLSAVVGSLGHEVLEVDESEQMVVARDKDGVTYFLFGTACNAGGVSGCQGIMMQVRYNLPPEVTFETLAEANFKYAALNTWADFEEKTLGVTRYQVLDNGATMANIRANVAVMLDLAPDAAGIAAGGE
jgi:hypothetical protein